MSLNQQPPKETVMSDCAQPNPDATDSQDPTLTSGDEPPSTEEASEPVVGFLAIFTGGRVRVAE